MGITWSIKRLFRIFLVSVFAGSVLVLGGDEWEWVDDKPVCTKDGVFVHPKNPAIKILCARFPDHGRMKGAMSTMFMPCPPGSSTNAEKVCVDANGKPGIWGETPVTGTWRHDKIEGWKKLN